MQSAAGMHVGGNLGGEGLWLPIHGAAFAHTGWKAGWCLARWCWARQQVGLPGPCP